MNANLNTRATVNAAMTLKKDFEKDIALGGIVKIPKLFTIFNRISHKQIDEKLFKARFDANWGFYKEVLILAAKMIPSRKIRAIITALISFGDSVLN